MEKERRFSLLVLLVLMALSVQAQYVSPRRNLGTTSDNRNVSSNPFRLNRRTDGERQSRSDSNISGKKEVTEAKAQTSNKVAEQELIPLAKDEVSLMVSADGRTKEEATKSALRSAIELAFGTFVSSNTQILNDEMVKDEIITVSSGNIKDYKYVSEKEENGKYYVTLQTTVVVGKLIEYTKSKGASAELAGATFAMNLKMKKLRAANIEKAINNLEEQITPLLENCFSYDEIKVGEPVARRIDVAQIRYVSVPVEVYVKTNSNLTQARNIVNNTAYALAEHLELPYNFFNEIESVRQSPKDELYKYLSAAYRYHSKGKSSEKDMFVAQIKGLANMYIPLESILKFKVVDNLGEYSFRKTDKWVESTSRILGGGVMMGYLVSDKRIGNVSLYDTSHLSEYKSGGRWTEPGNSFSAYDYFKPLPPHPDRIDERNREYQISVLEGEREIAYVVKLELIYTEEEIAQISDIKVLPIDEFKK